CLLLVMVVHAGKALSQPDSAATPCVSIDYNQLPINENLKSSFAETICKWMGTPYHYSGDSKKGIDCSGFVSVLFKSVFNIELAASSKEIYLDNVVPLKKTNLIPSDLVFFKIRKKKVSHVGVYLGNNKFVHATVQQ